MQVFLKRVYWYLVRVNGTREQNQYNESHTFLSNDFFVVSVRKEQECYTVDGMVGTRVARQMTRGDKIRVGINGRLQSSNLRVKRWPKEKLK